MRVPESSDIASIPGWEGAYFQSEFTHAAGAVRLTSHPGGFIGLWRSLVGRKGFPVQYLTDRFRYSQLAPFDRLIWPHLERRTDYSVMG